MSRKKQNQIARQAEAIRVNTRADQAAAAERLYDSVRALSARAGGMYYVPIDEAPSGAPSRGWTLHERTSFNTPSFAGRVAPAPALA